MNRLLSALLLLAVVWADTCPGPLSLGPCKQTPPNSCPQQRAVCDVDSQFCCFPEDMVPDATNPPPCRDKINILTGQSDCPFKKNLCNNTQYTATMHDECPLTCGFCTPSRVTTAKTTAMPCEDKLDSTGKNECIAHIAFCTDPAWKETMKEQCPKSCGYCS